MRTFLIVATVVEVVLVIGVLAVHLVLITRTLRRTNRYLGQVAFGVRAIESQTRPIGPSVTRLNEQLVTIDAAFEGLAGIAEAPAGQPTGGASGG